MVVIDPTMSLFILNVSCLNTPIKTRVLSTDRLKKKDPTIYVVYKKRILNVWKIISEPSLLCSASQEDEVQAPRMTYLECPIWPPPASSVSLTPHPRNLTNCHTRLCLCLFHLLLLPPGNFCPSLFVW